MDTHARVFMWGENTDNLRLRKPKLFYKHPLSNVGIAQVVLGRRHGVIRTNERMGGVYFWGDGTYGELGTQEDIPIENPRKSRFFSVIAVTKIEAGARHTLVLDADGNIFAMGDNSEEQCAISGRRANEPEKILKDFRATDIFAGDSHNIAVSEDGSIYSWGGATINSSWA